MKVPQKRHGPPLQPAHPEQEDGHARLPAISPTLARLFGPFGSAIVAICSASLVSLELARSDTTVIVIGVIAVVAMTVTYLGNLKKAA